jgi:hypothetical protein
MTLEEAIQQMSDKIKAACGSAEIRNCEDV